MNRLPPVSLNMRRSLLVIELFALASSIWAIFANPHLQRSPFAIEQTILFVMAFMPFIIIFPVDRPLWQRRIYIILAILTVVIADYHEFTSYSLYATFLLKGCFFLPRKEIITIAIIFWTVSSASYSSRIANIIERMQQSDLSLYLNPPRLIVGYIASYFGSCIFVLLLGTIWTEEQKSRQKAERLTQQVETLAVDLERNRIARDIHDTLGHSLTSLDVQIELAQRLQATEPERAQQSIDLAKKLSSQALDNVRQALGTMKRSNFDLTEAIFALAEQNLPFEVHVDVSFPQLSLQSSYQLYCIVQESLTNIQKHAQANRVTIESTIVNRGTLLEICDNGKGFDLDRPHAGFGLRNMKERVQCLGGEFNLDTEVGRGTQIKIFVPASS
ncbi:sensor histidine kinase [Chamaesiphon polymorphus]|nr:sensor histidine kinase [Chamaesiphon polymorphus]